MKDFFKPEDFESSAKVIAMRNAGLYGLLNWKQMAEVANAKLNAYLQSLTPVYGDARLGHYHGAPILWSIDEKTESTHKARIISVEAIQPK